MKYNPNHPEKAQFAELVSIWSNPAISNPWGEVVVIDFGVPALVLPHPIRSMSDTKQRSILATAFACFFHQPINFSSLSKGCGEIALAVLDPHKIHGIFVQIFSAFLVTSGGSGI